MDDTYCVRKIYKDDRDNETVEGDLTRQEAMDMVEEDVCNNPNAVEYMLVFNRE